MSTPVMIRFECGSQEKEPLTLGPFEWVQLTYSELRDETDNCIAFYEKGYWFTQDNDAFSDIVIFSGDTEES